jgi:hypothetical protein
MALGAAIDPGWTIALYVALLFVVVEPLVGYVVEPLLYGHSTGLSPVSVIVSAVFWTWLWGPIGLIMSTPLTLCLVVMGRHVKSLEFFDVLLGDRPALTPVESFYQRLLANNPDEALAQAETLLADRPLVAYYDGVVMEGLRLALEDQARGTIDQARAAAMVRSMRSIVEDVQARVDAAPGSNGSPKVAVVAGAGLFDQAVGAMLAQLLGEQGIAVRTIAAHQVDRTSIETVDLSEVSVVAVAHLEIVGSPAQLRYLVRRLRAKAPAARFVVGMWPPSDASMGDAVVQKAMGADHCVSSLADATSAISALLEDRSSVAA